MFCANIFRKKFIFSFIFSLYIQINTLNLHIFANNLIYCLFLRIIAEFILIILYTLLYIEKKHRRRSHLWEVSSIHRRHLAPLGGIIHPPPPPRTSGRYHLATAATSHLWEAVAYSIHPQAGRSQAKPFRAAGVSRLNEGSRVFPEIGISLIINYLSSPLGR